MANLQHPSKPRQPGSSLIRSLAWPLLGDKPALHPSAIPWGPSGLRAEQPEQRCQRAKVSAFRGPKSPETRVASYETDFQGNSGVLAQPQCAFQISPSGGILQSPQRLARLGGLMSEASCSRAILRSVPPSRVFTLLAAVAFLLQALPFYPSVSLIVQPAFSFL